MARSSRHRVVRSRQLPAPHSPLAPTLPHTRWGEMQVRLPRPRRVRAVEKSRTGCAGAAGGRASVQAQGGRVFLANQVSEWGFCWPWVRKGRTTRNRRPDRRARRQLTASLPRFPGLSRYIQAFGGILVAKSMLPCSLLLTIARNCPARGALSKCPRTVSRSRSASRRAQDEPMLRKGNVL